MILGFIKHAVPARRRNSPGPACVSPCTAATLTPSLVRAHVVSRFTPPPVDAVYRFCINSGFPDWLASSSPWEFLVPSPGLAARRMRRNVGGDPCWTTGRSLQTSSWQAREPSGHPLGGPELSEPGCPHDRVDRRSVSTKTSVVSRVTAGRGGAVCCVASGGWR